MRGEPVLLICEVEFLMPVFRRKDLDSFEYTLKKQSTLWRLSVKTITALKAYFKGGNSALTGNEFIDCDVGQELQVMCKEIMLDICPRDEYIEIRLFQKVPFITGIEIVEDM